MWCGVALKPLLTTSILIWYRMSFRDFVGSGSSSLLTDATEKLFMRWMTPRLSRHVQSMHQSLGTAKRHARQNTRQRAPCGSLLGKMVFLGRSEFIAQRGWGWMRKH